MPANARLLVYLVVPATIWAGAADGRAQEPRPGEPAPQEDAPDADEAPADPDDDDDFVMDADAEAPAPDEDGVDPEEVEQLRSDLRALTEQVESLQGLATASRERDLEADEGDEEDVEDDRGRGPQSRLARSDSPVDASHALNEMGHFLAKGVFLSSYMQAEYMSRQDSEDALLPGGDLANRDGFGVRRSRIKLTADYQYAGGIVEFDGSTTGGGYNVSIRRAEVYLQYRKNPEDRPLLQLAAGVIDTLFGYELNVSSRARPFMERSLIIRSIWPSPADVGARASGAYKWFRYSVQALNGQPRFTVDGFPGLAPTKGKDFLVKLGADVDVNDTMRVAGNISTLKGTGFHAGRQAIKGGVGWSDSNEDGIIQAGTELIPIPSRAERPGETFNRWAVGADLQVEFETKLGLTQIYGEFILAQNMDRALYVSDPVVTGVNQRMFGFYAAVVQEITPYVLVGFRYDQYEPDSDLMETRAGRIFPFDQRIQTFSPLVGFQIPGRARLMFQYDLIDDFFGRDPLGVPTNLRNNAWTMRLQVQL
jgi:hypothetical protein